MMSWADKSKPQRPIRERIVPATKPDAATRGRLSAQKKANAAPKQIIWRLRNHIPDLVAPIRFMTRGAIQVAESSKIVAIVRVVAIVKEV